MASPPRPVPETLLNLTDIYRLTVAQYRKMLVAGILMENEPVELLEGYLVNQPRPQPPPSASVRTRIHRAFLNRPFAGWDYQSVGATTLDDSEPEPDFLIARGDERTYLTRFPGPGEVGLVGEVSGSSLDFDRREKGRIYSRVGIPVYWIINLVDRQIEVYSEPDAAANPPGYRSRTDYRPGDQLPVTLDGTQVGTVPVGELLP